MTKRHLSLSLPLLLALAACSGREAPAPAAPPLIPKVGPSEGCRSVAMGRRPIRARRRASPTG